MTEEMQKKVQELPLTVDVSDPEDEDDDVDENGKPYRYVAVSE
jgi:hypothetical protein